MVQARSIFTQNKLTSFILLSIGAHLLLFLCFKTDIETSFISPEKAVVKLKTVRPAVVNEETVSMPVPAEKPAAMKKTADSAVQAPVEPIKPKLHPEAPNTVVLNRVESAAPVFVNRSAQSVSSPGSAASRGPQTIRFTDAAIGAEVPKPGYPDIAKRWGHEGLVTVEILITEDGEVAKAELLSSSGYMELDDAALQVILTRWKFAPAGYEIRTVKEFEFKLKR